MKVYGQHYRTIWMEGQKVSLIDQNLLPFQFKIIHAADYQTTIQYIKNMNVRGAGAIGAAAAFAMAQAILEAPDIGFNEFLSQARNQIESSRPTAKNLFRSTERIFQSLNISKAFAIQEAQAIARENEEDAIKIGEYGASLINDGYRILTHCNAGWLGFVDYGSALSPVYKAFEQGKNIFVYVDETRPRNQGAKLTAWELYHAGIRHRIIADNAAAHFMSLGKIDMVITGADRVAINGDTANKIGTLAKAIAAKEFGIPFYIAVPGSTIDTAMQNGAGIEIEERNEDELLYSTGADKNGNITEIKTANPGSGALNPAFDVTPAKFITAFITEKGIIKPDELKNVFYL